MLRVERRLCAFSDNGKKAEYAKESHGWENEIIWASEEETVDDEGDLSQSAGPERNPTAEDGQLSELDRAVRGFFEVSEFPRGPPKPYTESGHKGHMERRQPDHLKLVSFLATKH